MAEFPWPVLSSDMVFEHRWYRLRRDVVRFPDGATDEYFVSMRPEVALVVPITTDGRVILVRQYKHGVRRRLLEFPAGTFRDEDPRAAALRELAEETGYAPGRVISLGQVFDDGTRNDNAVHMFAALDCTFAGTQDLEPSEVAAGLEVVEMTVPQMIAALDAGEIDNLSSLAAGYRAVRALNLG